MGVEDVFPHGIIRCETDCGVFGGLAAERLVEFGFGDTSVDSGPVDGASGFSGDPAEKPGLIKDVIDSAGIPVLIEELFSDFKRCAEESGMEIANELIDLPRYFIDDLSSADLLFFDGVVPEVSNPLG